MIARNRACPSADRDRPTRRIPALLVVGVVVSIGLFSAWGPVTRAHDDMPSPEPVSTLEAAPIATTEPPSPEPALADASTFTEQPTPIDEPPSAEAPPPAEPTSEPTAVEEPPPTDATATLPTPTPAEEATNDEPVMLVNSNVRLATASIEGCAIGSGSTSLGQGQQVVYECAYAIVVPVASITAIDLQWTVAAAIAAGWTVELRTQEASGGSPVAWTPQAAGAAATLADVPVIDLREGDDEDVEPTTFTHTVHFGVRLTSPACGGPINPTVTLTARAAATIHNDPDPATMVFVPELWDSTSIAPTLNIGAPSPVLTSGGAGGLANPNDPLHFSHSPHVVDAGTLHLSVTSGDCGGWTAAISATDFSDGGAGGFAASNLAVTSIEPMTGAPAPVAGPLTLSTDEQALVAAAGQSVGSGDYAYTLHLELTVPGGTPPGTYTSIVTVTTSAAP